MLKYIIIFFTSISIAVSATISFNIDAGNLDIPNADYQSIVVNGSWNNWEPWGVTLSDSNEDGIFSGEIDLDNGTYEYLISATGPADNWSGWGLVINAPMGSDCDYYPGDEWPNYGFVVNNSDIEQSYCAGSCDSQCENNGGGENLNYTLVWSDEFDENEIDETKWNFEIGTGNGGWGNGEEQYYTSRSENAFIEDGKLIIQALNESYAGSNYTSAKMTTENKADFLYGKIVASIKVPAAGGTWPAFWMLPTNSVYGGWPNSGEMDIMEHYGCDPGHVHSTVHNNTYNWAGGIPPTGYNIYTNATSEFLEYEMEWSDDELKFFVDGSYIGTYYNEDNGWQQWPYDQEFYIILNLAIGSYFMACETEGNLFPQRYEIDYVRVYQLTDGCTNPEACNYDETATADDGSCEYEVDECGECGGDGSSCACTPGDVVNDDGITDILDVVAIVGYVLGNSTLTDQQILCADFTGDGMADILDIVAIVDSLLYGD
tara:strand:+ start:106 stop:1569 length:1464 start_codon:yes stop_codon:yes gene_type:complete